ncbi:MAG: response regulator [Anaerolineae bacterium]|nr:response regulator [Anaerolineae bacterium]MEB2288307.1 response regulator [Anaerolineae bacterium]
MHKATILVVEDDLHLMEGVRDILELNGYEVWTASNGQAGLQMLQDKPRPPDLIVSDIMMPRMDGYDFFGAVRAEPNWVHIPFIFLTAKGEHEDVKRGKRMGAEDYVIKPFDADDLLVAVSAKLERRRQIERHWQNEVSTIKQNILMILNHEFRTPLTYVVAYADMVHRDADALGVDDMRAFLRGINAGANRLRRLVENFILLVELETGEAAQTFSWRREMRTDFEALLGSAIAKYQDVAGEKQVTISVAVDEDLPPIRADAQYLVAAVECLIDNAVKFSDKPGTVVTVRAYRDGGGVCLAVRDQGRGIPPGERENIFQSFYQIERHKYEDQGAGSGLAIVNRVTRLHGGHITLTSAVGEGSEFVIRLPAASTGDDDAPGN